MKDHSFALVLIRAVVTFSVGMLTADLALADRKHHHRHHSHHQPVYYEQVRHSNDVYGRVVNARPIYQSVAIEVPQESCHVETVAHSEHRRSRNGDSFGSTVVGGLVGAAIGHEIGNGRGGATAVGGLIGAAIGNDTSKHSRVVSYSDREVCNTHYRTEYENRIIGYDVSYRYEGRIYETRTDRHPGDRVSVALHYSNYPN